MFNINKVEYAYLRFFSYFDTYKQQWEYLNNIFLNLFENSYNEKCTFLKCTFLENIDTLFIEPSKSKDSRYTAFFIVYWHLCSETVTERVNTLDDIR